MLDKILYILFKVSSLEKYYYRLSKNKNKKIGQNWRETSMLNYKSVEY